MIELTIRTDNLEALQKLLEFISKLDFKVVKKKGVPNKRLLKPSGEKARKENSDKKELPVQWGEDPESLKDLFGIWKDNPRTLEEIRELAWGGRL